RAGFRLARYDTETIEVVEPANPGGIGRVDNQPALTPGPFDEDRRSISQSAADGGNIPLARCAIVEVKAGRDPFGPAVAREPVAAAIEERGEAAARLAHRPVEQRVVTAEQDVGPI